MEGGEKLGQGLGLGLVPGPKGDASTQNGVALGWACKVFTGTTAWASVLVAIAQPAAAVVVAGIATATVTPRAAHLWVPCACSYLHGFGRWRPSLACLAPCPCLCPATMGPEERGSKVAGSDGYLVMPTATKVSPSLALLVVMVMAVVWVESPCHHIQWMQGPSWGPISWAPRAVDLEVDSGQLQGPVLPRPLQPLFHNLCPPCPPPCPQGPL